MLVCDFNFQSISERNILSFTHSLRMFDRYPSSVSVVRTLKTYSKGNGFDYFSNFSTLILKFQQNLNSLEDRTSLNVEFTP